MVLVVIDGLSVDQWVVLRDELSEKQQALQFQEDAVFCWIPTTTSVSRQALFAGKAPLYFPGSIHTTEKESALWIQFWIDQGLAQHQIAYKRGLGNESLDELRESLSQPQLRIVGLVVDKVDKIMHGMELGTAGMHNQVRQWALGGYINKLIDILQSHGFRVWITSDHGNIEAEGCGRPEEGAIADIRGERVRVYSNPLLRSKVQMRFPDAIDWPLIGLPEDYLPLLAKGRTAFIPEGKKTVAHGGITIEEAIVPLIQVADRDQRQSENRQRSEP